MNAKSDKIRWKKNCPKCGKEQVYSCKSSLTLSIRKNAVCKQCQIDVRKIISPMGGWKRVCSLCGDIMNYSCRKAWLICEKNRSLCKSCGIKKSYSGRDISWMKSSEYKEKMSNSLKIVRTTDKYGDQFKQKCRENKLKQIYKQGTQRTYNITACKFMDELNSKFGWNLQHAMNGGEVQFIGYSLDGYDKHKNIVFEYDEPKHYITWHKKKDEERQRRIINAIHPSAFYRYDEKNKKLVEVVENKEIICPTQ